MTAVVAQLFAEIMADRTLGPAALRLRVAPVATDAPIELPAGDALAGLAARLPCVLGAGEWHALPPAVTDALAAAGCRMVAGDAIWTAHELNHPPLPEAASYLAGDWYLAPPPKPGAAQHASRPLALQLLQLVAADADTHEIETILRHDPALSYHLLRLVNSLNRGGRHITSFAQAILILGRQQLRRWLNLILFAAHKDDPRSRMLTARVSVRARAMELLAHAAGFDKARQESAFMAGMFSLLGVLFGMALADVLEPLNLDAPLAAAVLRREGDLGTLLAIVEAADAADAAGIGEGLARVGLPAAAFGAIGLDAVAWMLDVVTGAAHE